MLNVGGSAPRLGPLVHGLTIALNKCPATEEKSMAPNASHGDKIRNSQHVGIVAT